jgi:hypothetical protein
LEPEITSWGSFSRRSGADGGSGAVHALFCQGNWRSAVAVARHFGIEEYGGSGYGPLDSAFHSRVFEAVEELTRFNPLLAIGPVESVKHERKTSRIPLVCFFEDLKNSGGWSRVMGLTRKSAGEGEDYVGLEEIARKWIGTAYDVAGSLEDKKNWQAEIEMFKKASDTGKLRVHEALDALSAMATEGSKRLAIPPKQSKSLKQALCTTKGAAALLNKESWEKRWEEDEQNRLKKAMERLAQVAGARPLTGIALKVGIQRANAVGSSQRGGVTASEILEMAEAMSAAEEERGSNEVPAPSVADIKAVTELNNLAIVAKIEKRRTVVKYNKAKSGARTERLNSK